MAPYDDDDVLMPLVGGDSSNNNRGNGNNGASGQLINRILILITLAALVAVSVFFQSSSSQLSQQLESDESKIQQLQDTVKSQAFVIERFNHSVSNSDVLKQLKTIELNLETTQHELNDELDAVEQEVTIKLEKTLKELDQTVQAAENEIQDQVDTVKKNFDKYVVVTQDQFSMENSFMVYQLAGTFTLLACLISMWHMTAHLRKLKQPVIQRRILSILWMPPIYAITSWFSLVFTPAEGYLAIIKDAYEAYIIYQFLSFCIAVLGKGDRNSVVDILSKRADHLTPPFRLFPCCKRDPYENDRALADAILLQCQFFAMQFVFLRPITTIARVVLDKYQYFGPFGAEGPNDYRSPQFYVTVIQNISIFTAFTGLLKFYHAVDKDLAWCRPFAKFLCIKGVVFMTFWQGLAITVLAEMTDVGADNTTEWAMAAQNFLICLEMLLFSIAHFYCFPTEEWEENFQANFTKGQFGETLAFGDFVADLKLIMMANSTPKKKRKKIKKKLTESEPIPEEDEDEEQGGCDGSAGTKESDNDEEQQAPHRESQRSAEEEEESETDNDETTVTSDCTSDEDPNKALAEAVSKTLESQDTDSAELQLARERLLQSLDEFSFALPAAPKAPTPEKNSTTHHEALPATPKAPTPGKNSASHHDVEYGDKENIDAEDQEVSERTGLLSGTPSQTRNDEMLRPSIFTTMAEISSRSPTKSNEGD